MLRWLLEQVLNGEAIARFRERLKNRLEGGRESELLGAQEELRKAERTRDRLARLLGEIDDDDPTLEQQYFRTREEALRLQDQVVEIEQGLRDINPEAIQKQLGIDLPQVVEAFLSEQNTPERTRALLNRIFPRLVLVGKTDRYTAIFEVHVKPGAILAEASNTAELVDEQRVMRVRLNTSSSKYPVWTVENISEDEARPANAGGTS